MKALVKRDAFVFVLALLILIFILKKIAGIIPGLETFGDEQVFNTAALNFFLGNGYRTESYTVAFEPSISNGLLMTWPAGLALLNGASLTGARWALVAWDFFLYFSIAGIVATTNHLNKVRVFLIACIVLFFITKTPYWLGFLMNLGEFPTALVIGIAISLIRYPFISFQIATFAAWNGKIIYLPLVVVCYGFYFLQRFMRKEISLQKMLWLPVLTLSPLLFIFALNLMTYGKGEALALIGLWDKILFGNSFGGPAGPTQVFGISNRLNTLEWVHYTKMAKLTIVSLLLMPFALLFYRQKKQREWNFLSVGVLVAIVIDYAYYFLWHPLMWLRYLQPAIYFSIGLCTWLLVEQFGKDWLRLPAYARKSE